MEGFKCAAFVLGAGSASQSLSAEAVIAAAEATLPPGALAAHPDMLLAWADTMDTFGPDTFSALQRSVKEEVAPGPPSLKLALATVRMAGYDADVFFKFKAVLIERTPAANEKTQADIARDVKEVRKCWRRHGHTRPRHAVPFLCPRTPHSPHSHSPCCASCPPLPRV